MARNKVFWWAFGVSLALHLSAVTVFRIVIYFPREDILYARFELIDSTTDLGHRWPTREELKVPSPDGAFERAAGDPLASNVERYLSGLPDIELPTVEFAGLELLRLRKKGLEIRSQYQELFREKPQDAWSRFGRSLAIVGGTLSRMAQEQLGLAEAPPSPVSQPAPGFEAFLEWMAPPKDRQAMSVSKIEALWGLDPADLDEPIALFFKVNRDGKVVGIVPQMEDDHGIVVGAVRALFQYRFEPVDDSAPRNHAGVLIIRPAKGRAP